MTLEKTAKYRRRSPREVLNAATVLHVQGEEFLCRTRDISENGLGFVIRDASIKADEIIEADVLIDNVLAKFRGAIVYFRSADLGDMHVGIRFVEKRPVGDDAGPRPSDSTDEKGLHSSQTGEAEGKIDHSPLHRGRRSYGRRKVRLQAQIEPGRHPGVVEDISTMGASVWSPTLIAPGQKVRLTILSVHGVQRIAGVVKWARRERGDNESSGRACMGVAFTGPLQHPERIVDIHGHELE